MSTLLLYPPITDPTSGYHSLCYLETYARKNGFEDIDIVDTNIEAFLYSMRSDQVQKVLDQIQIRKNELEKKPFLDVLEQVEYYYIWKAESFPFSKLQSVVEVMRKEETFYDFQTYRSSVEVLTGWLDVLSLLGFPGQFDDFALTTRYLFNLQSSEELCDYSVTERILAPFAPYFEQVLLPKIEAKQYQTVGINVTYIYQLPFALAIGRMIRARFPEIVLLYGGTEVSDVWKYLQEKDRFYLIFDAADACVIGEGELAFTQLLETVRDQKEFRSIPNVHFHPKYKISESIPTIQYLDITELPTPDYSKLNWDLYLSPHPYVYYSPSRGCYWNKCTFCDYGLNGDSPTSPWRHYSVEKVLGDLREISKNYKFVYFSVDVLSPAMLLHLAERLVEEKIDIRWGAEIRLEKYWSPERCALLKASGCTAISVGFESGNQRILDLIDKGTQPERVRETIINFHNANIGVQIMGFTGFPTETFEEAMDSVRFLRETSSYWTLGGLGTFSLTPGAIVAKQPERFGLQNVQSYEGEDIVRTMYYEEGADTKTPQQEAALSKAKFLIRPVPLGRPWVGGVDTAHSMFYHDRFDVKILDQIFGNQIELNTKIILNGRIVQDAAGYPIGQLARVDNLIQFRMNYKKKNLRGLTSKNLLKVMEHYRLEKQSEPSKRRYFIGNDEKIIDFSEQILDFLSWFKNGNTLLNYFDHHPDVDQSLFKRLLNVCLSKSALKIADSSSVSSNFKNQASFA